VTVEALEPLALKGKGRPVQAYRLIAVEPGRPPSPSGLDVAMVGRADEKERLEEAFRDAAERQACRLVTVLGTAGVGKSRLTAEFLAGIDARVVTGRCLSYGEGITYWPVVEVVKQLGDVGERLTAESPQVAAALGALMGEGSAATAGEIAWAVRRLFEEAAAERPLVVVFDDIHWGERTFLDLVEHVSDLSHDASILIVCLARPELLEQRPAWSGSRPDATTLLLQPLDPGDTGELIDRLVVVPKDVGSSGPPWRLSAVEGSSVQRRRPDEASP
jgi:predicted ATPase